jgi:hypothetical protein
MADAKISSLTANTTPLETDLLVMVDDPSGTPLTQKMTMKTAKDMMLANYYVAFGGYI